MHSPYQKSCYLVVNKQPLAGTSLVTWVKVLRENNFAIDWRFLPKALYVTTLVLLITPLRAIEQRTRDRNTETIPVNAPIFIIGHWRSGTTFFHYLMGQDRNLGYTSTMDTLGPMVFLRFPNLLKSLVSKSLPATRPMDNLEMDPGLPYEEEYAIANLSPYSFYHAWYFPQGIDRYFDRYVLFEGVPANVVDEWKQVYSSFLRKITYKYGGKQVMLKSLVNTARVRYLLEMYPDAKFIHLVRNPYSVYMSTWKLYNSILPLFSFQHINREAFDGSILRIYKRLYEQYLEEKPLIPAQNLVELHYEDFVRNPLERLEAIYTQLGIPGFEHARPAFQAYLERHKDYKKQRHVMDKKIADKVYAAWEFAFKAFGYPKELDQ